MVQAIKNHLSNAVKKYSRLEVKGHEHLPARGEGALLVCNHSGNLWWDALCLLSGIDRPVNFIAHYWDASIKPIKTLLEKVDSFFLDENNEDIDQDNIIVKGLKKGRLMCIYPEESYHSFWHRYTLFKFSSQALHYAERADVPIIPVVVIGAEEAAPLFAGIKWPKVPLHIPLHLPLILPMKVTIEIGEPLSVQDIKQRTYDNGDACDDDGYMGTVQRSLCTLIDRHKDCKRSNERYLDRKSYFF